MPSRYGLYFLAILYTLFPAFKAVASKAADFYPCEYDYMGGLQSTRKFRVA